MPLAFVTGASGFLGRGLIEQLAAAGWEIVAFHRPGSNLSGLADVKPRFAAGDLRDPGSVLAAMPAGADAVFHVAANTSMWSRNAQAQWRDNVEGTEAVLAAAERRQAKRLVHVSTWATYGMEHAAISEATPQTGKESWVAYTRTKFFAEAAVREAASRGLPAVIVNPSHILGRYDDHGWGRMIVMAARRRLPGIPPGAGSFCHAEAVAKALIAAAERGRIGHNYLLGGTDASFRQLIAIIGEVAGVRVPRFVVPGPVLRLYARAAVALAAITGREPDATPEGVSMVLAHPRIISTKAADELGYAPVPLRLMVEDAYRWLKRSGRLG
jgi:nucleoside-diphosphate-sugar epimerase